MVAGHKRRMTNLEQLIRPPTTTARFFARVEAHARLTGQSLPAAMDSLVHTLSDQDLDRLIAEAEELMERHDRRGAAKQRMQAGESA